ncbi:uncharacterized protein [Panulirus ornatus]
MGVLCSAVCEHRWDDAFRLLPCVIIRMVRDVPQDFLWRMTDVITRNATDISLSLRQQLRRDICHLNVKADEVVLDSLSQDLETADKNDVDNLIQMMEDFSQKKSSNQFSVKGHQQRVQALLDGYIGQVLYYRWKNCNCQNEEASLAEMQNNTVTSSKTADIDWPIMHEIFGSHELTAVDKWQVLAKQAHGAMKKALANLKEPCEWLMEQYLDLENELYGTDAAVSTLKIYLEKNPNHLPAHRLSYHFHKHNVPDSNVNQVKALKEIARMCPDDPLVLEYVDVLLRGAEHKLVGTPKQRESIHMDSDSGLDDWASIDKGQTANDDEISSPESQEKQPCLLKSSEHVQALMTCLKLVIALLEYKEFVWKLQPWQKLTCILRKFYLAWINCWSCLLCKQSRKLVDQVAKRVIPLWQYYVWTSVPEQISVEEAHVLFHHIFSAHVFSYSMDYISRARTALYSNGYQPVADELNCYLDHPSPFLKKFNEYSRVKGRRYKRRENETFGSYEHQEKQIEEYEQNGIQNSNSLECIQNSCEENKFRKIKNETDPLSLVDGKEQYNVESQVGRIFTNRMETQSCENLVNIPSPVCDVSFDEHGILPTSTQVRDKIPGNSPVCDVSFDECDILLTSTQVKDKNPGNPLFLKRACLAVDPLHNGSFIGCSRTSPVVDVNSADPLCMENAKNWAESPHKQKQTLCGSEIQTEIGWKEMNSGNISQNNRLHAVEDRRDETSNETEVVAENTGSSSIVFPPKQESEMHNAPDMVQSSPNIAQSFSFEADNFLSTVDICNEPELHDNSKPQQDKRSESRSNEPELLDTSKPQQDKKSESKIMSIDKKTKRHLLRRKRKPMTLISSCPTSPNHEQQNRDLDMNVVEENYDPQSQYYCSFSDNLRTQYNSNTFSSTNYTANQISHDEEVKCSVVSGGTKILHTPGLDVSDGRNCYGNEDLLQENYMKNSSNQGNYFLEDISGNKTSVPNSGISREKTENSHNLRPNHHHRFDSYGNSSEEAESSIPCGQKWCKSGRYLAENSQEQGNTLSPEKVEKVRDDNFYLQSTPLPSDLSPCAFVPFRHESFKNNDMVVEETLTQLSMNDVDGIHIIPETQSQVTEDEKNLLQMETLAGGLSKVTTSNDQKASEQSKRIAENSEIEYSSSENEIIGTPMKDDVAGTQESVTSLTFSLTPGQRVPQYDGQNAQEFYSFMDLDWKIDIDGFCLTKEELCQDDESLFVRDYQNGTLIYRPHTVSANASFASEHQSNDLQHHQPVTSPRQVPKMYSDDGTDEMNFSKSTVERVIRSLGSNTSLASEVSKDEDSNSEYCIGPTHGDFNTLSKRQMIHQSMSCDSLSLGNNVPESIGETDSEISDLYESLPALRESFQSNTLYSPKTPVKEEDYVNEENVSELTPLSALHLTGKEKLELSSQPSNESDANCQESISMSLSGFTPNKTLVTTDEVFPPKIGFADQDKVMSKRPMVCIPRSVYENTICTHDTLYRIVNDSATDKPNMDDHCHQDETKEDLNISLKINDQREVNVAQIEDEILENYVENESISDDHCHQDENKDISSLLKINDQEKVISAQVEDEILENNAENERISNVTVSDCKDKSDFEYKSFEILETVAETRSEKNTRRKKAVRKKRKRNLTDEFTNSVNHDNMMMRKHVQCCGNCKDTVDYFQDKDERMCNDTNFRVECNLEHKSTEEESDTLNKQQKLVSCRKQDAVPLESEANKNAKKRKFSEEATTRMTAHELVNHLTGNCKVKEHQRYSESKHSVKNQKVIDFGLGANKNAKKRKFSKRSTTTLTADELINYLNEKYRIRKHQRNYRMKHFVKIGSKIDQKVIDFWLECTHDLPLPDIIETNGTKILDKSLKKIKTFKVLTRYQIHEEQKKKFEMSCIEDLPLPDISIDMKKTKRNPPEKSEKSSELFFKQDFRKVSSTNEQIKVSQCLACQENKTDIQFVAKCHEKEYDLKDSSVPMQRFKEIQKTTIEGRAQEKNDGYDFVEGGSKNVDEPVIASEKRKRRHWNVVSCWKKVKKKNENM